jgi:hypothetical protein
MPIKVYLGQKGLVSHGRARQRTLRIPEAIAHSRFTVAALGEFGYPDAHGRSEAGVPEMTSDQPSTARSRVAVKPHGSARGQLDGGWWPTSDDLAAEAPALAGSLWEQVGAVSRISYHLDGWPATRRKLTSNGRLIRLEGFYSMERNTVVVIGADARRVTLLLVPHGTPGGMAQALLRSAARPESTDSADEILTGNGLQVPRASQARQRREADGGSLAVT